MALFQKAPRTREEYEQYPPLEVPPEEVLEMSEEEWYARVYQGGDAPQLTGRAVLMGSLLGFFLAYTNLYVGLKSGWALGVAITACIVSFSTWQFLLRIGVAKTPMTILEMNCMQSTASSAGYSTGGIMVSAIAALLLLSASPEHPGGQHLPVAILVLWTLFLAALGVFLAIPMKRNMINRERLRFPSGTAAAVTLQSLYSHGGEAVAKARALFWSALAGALIEPAVELDILRLSALQKVAWLRDLGRDTLLPPVLHLFDFLPGAGAAGRSFKPSDWTLVFDNNPVMIAAGMLVGLRIAISMTLSGLFLAYVLGPLGMDALWIDPEGNLVGAVTSPGNAWREIGIWTGVPILVASGLLSFLWDWRTIVRAFRGLRGGNDESEMVLATEVPMSWFASGVVVTGGATVALAAWYFGIPPHYGALAVLLTFVLSLVACRATGESDITPTGAMGKIMQLIYGVLMPQNATANLMTAGITASSSGAAADLLNDLKSGYLLGANPRRQFVAQLLGVFAGTAATVSGFYLLVPDTTPLQDGTFPAPSAQAWLAVARLFQKGIANLHPMDRHAIFWGLLAGALMVVAEKARPRWRKYLPSATGIGLGLILPFQYPLSMLLGAFLAWAWHRRNTASASRYVVPVASGLIAGVSILGVITAALNSTLLAG